jgi:hypothetical protein
LTGPWLETGQVFFEGALRAEEFVEVLHRGTISRPTAIAFMQIACNEAFIMSGHFLPAGSKSFQRPVETL